ncbi:MAG: hypothetical protein WA821_12000 [Anaerolineales bacterium]
MAFTAEKEKTVTTDAVNSGRHKNIIPAWKEADGHWIVSFCVLIARNASSDVQYLCAAQAARQTIHKPFVGRRTICWAFDKLNKEINMVTFFERIAPKRVHYSIYWLFVGGVAALIEWLFFLFFIQGTNSNFLIPGILLTYVIASGIPIGYIMLSHYFQVMLKGIENAFDIPDTGWANTQSKVVFSLSSPRAKIILFLVIIITIVLCLSVLPFATTIRITISVLSLPLCFIGSYAVYTSIELLSLLNKIVKFKSKLPFYTPLNIAISPISKFYSLTATGSLFLYGLHIVSLWMAHLINNPFVMIWVITTAFFPLGMYLVSFYAMHQIMGNIKAEYIKEINVQINSTLNKLKNDLTNEHANSLDKMMEIQRKVELLKEWPFEIEGILTLMVTTAVPIVQIGISVYDKFTP